MDPDSLWSQQARHWSRVRAPLRPGAADIARMQTWVDAWRSDVGCGPRVLVLGSTPELGGMRWPAGSLVTAVDSSLPMLRCLWPAAVQAGVVRPAVQADWLSLPVVAGAWDLVVGDGCYVLMQRATARGLTAAVQRALRPGGDFLIRVFTRPEEPVAPETVWARLRAGEYGNFHVFKFRLLMALERGDGEVRVSGAWEFVSRRCASLETLAEELGWPVEEVRTLEAYAGQSAVYWFPTVAEFRRVVGECFTVRECLESDYEMGERCWLFRLQARSGAELGNG